MNIFMGRRSPWLLADFYPFQVVLNFVNELVVGRFLSISSRSQFRCVDDVVDVSDVYSRLALRPLKTPLPLSSDH